jgi:hypothetical protein
VTQTQQSSELEIQILQIATDDGKLLKTRLLSKVSPRELGPRAVKSAHDGDGFVEFATAALAADVRILDIRRPNFEFARIGT